MKARLVRLNGSSYVGELPDAEVYPALVRWADRLWVRRDSFFVRDAAVYQETNAVDDFECYGAGADEPNLSPAGGKDNG